MKNLKLNNLANQSLNSKEMNKVRGGGEPGQCCCGCMYEGTPGGSTFSANDGANDAKGLKSDNCLGPITIETEKKDIVLTA